MSKRANKNRRAAMKKNAIILIMSLWGGIGFAQPIDTAHFRMEFEPRLRNAQKINPPASITDTTISPVTFDYDVRPMRMDLSFTPTPVKAVKLKPEPRTDTLFRNFIKVGFGYPVTPLIEVSIHNRDNKKYSYGLNFHHFSSWAPQIGKQKALKKRNQDELSMTDLAYYPTSDTRLHLFFTRFFRHQTLYSSIDYKHDFVRLYGFKQSFFNNIDFGKKPYKDSLNNNFQQLHGEIGIRSNYTLEEKRLKQDVRLNYDLVYTHRRDMENHVGINSFFAYDARFLKISGYQNYRLDLLIDYWNNKWGISKGVDHSYKIEFAPSVNFAIKEYFFSLGVGLPIVQTPGKTNGKARFPIYPRAEVQLGIIPGILSIDGGITGSVKYNSLQSLLTENPYLKPDVHNLEFTKTQISIYGGVKGNLVKKLNYRIMARYSWVTDMAIFMLDTAYTFKNRFDVLFKSGNVLNASLNLNWEVIDHLLLTLDANYYGYYNFDMNYQWVNKHHDTLNMSQPWYQPSFTVSFGGKYLLKDRYLFNLSFNLAFERWALAPIFPEDGISPISYTVRKMRPLLDFNLGFEYRITKQFSAFINLNNIGCQYYSQYYNFNNFGLNVLAGITYSFGKESLKPAKKNRK
jgi:hypothetical protein